MSQKSEIIVTRYASPCGGLLLGSLGENLCLCDWVAENGKRGYVHDRLKRHLNARFKEGVSPVNVMAACQLDEYFAGVRRHFDLPVIFVGTEFQKSVWRRLTEIPYGATVSYRELSCGLGNRQAVRAVARANGANALSVIVPCHRVIGSNGSLTGYAGGLAAKEFLLRLEGVVL